MNFTRTSNRCPGIEWDEFRASTEIIMRTILVTCLLVAASVQHVFAWGEDGHAIVAEIAQRRLNDAARAMVERVLAHGSLASVASWADDAKFTNHRDTRPWHFVNIPLESTTYDAATDCRANDCVIAALAALKDELRCGKDDDTRLDALRFVVHFVGDIHQPLHTVKEDDGGNLIPVKANFCGRKQPGCTPDGRTVSFHMVWDETLIGGTVYAWGTYVERIEQGWLKSIAAQRVMTDGTGPVAWALEAHAAARTVWHRKPADNVIDEAYYSDVLPVVDQQLGAAGLRLARFLNEAYAGSQCVP
jgi:hypothetical protein